MFEKDKDVLTANRATRIDANERLKLRIVSTTEVDYPSITKHIGGPESALSVENSHLHYQVHNWQFPKCRRSRIRPAQMSLRDRESLYTG